MYHRRVDQILSNTTLWNERMPVALLSYLENNRLESWYNCQSRSLQSALNSTIGSYYGHHSAYNVLQTLCALITGKSLKINTGYKLISSEDAETLDIQTLINERNITPNKFNIFLYHIPKGKSYLRKALDQTEGLNRLKQIENFCIEDIQHFVRIYKGFNGLGEDSIVIFSDKFTKEFIQTLFVMLPILMNICEETATEEPLSAEQIKQNKKIKDLKNIFEEIFNQYNATASFTTNELRNEIDNIARLVQTFSDNFDFATAQLNTFATNLAKAKNNTANRYITRELSTTESTIKDYEQRIATCYVTKMRLEQQLINNKMITEDDTKPFIELINNTKAIEVLQTTDNLMKLRITAPVQYFTESDFEAYEKNTNSDYNRWFKNEPTLRKILHKIFVTREYKLLFQAIITLNLQDGYYESPLRCSAQTRNTTGLTQFPNPHLYHHDCWSKAKTEIQKNICEGNFELVVMQMIAAVQTVNIAEHASFINGFLYDILNNATLRDKITILDENQNTYDLTAILEHEKNIKLQETPKKAYTQIEIPDDDANWDDPAEVFERQHAEDIANEEGGDEDEED